MLSQRTVFVIPSRNMACSRMCAPAWRSAIPHGGERVRSVDSRRLAAWLICAPVLLSFLVIGRPLLVPFAFALLLWAVLNALTDALKRLRLPTALAWIMSLVLI